METSKAFKVTIAADIYHQWFKSVKTKLLQLEPQNIAVRAESCEHVINASTSAINDSLQINNNQLQNQVYECRVNTAFHLQFLLHWPGLRLSASSIKAPRTRREYEKKAKNWLNGRRAPNYGKTLFPYFIRESERYSDQIAKLLFHDHNKKQLLYYKALIHKILAGLCACAVSFNDQSKKAPFFCKNSVERKGELRDVLQSYAADHQYVQGFPSCAEEAVDYFTKRSNKYLAQFQQIDKIVPDACEIQDGVMLKAKLANGKELDMSLFWKVQVQDLQLQIAKEKLLRMNAEKERDQLQSVLDLLNDTNLINTTQTPIYHDQNVKKYNTTNTQYHDINVNQYALKLAEAANYNSNNNSNNSNNNNNDIGQRMAAALFDILRTDS